MPSIVNLIFPSKKGENRYDDYIQNNTWWNRNYNTLLGQRVLGCWSCENYLEVSFSKKNYFSPHSWKWRTNCCKSVIISEKFVLVSAIGYFFTPMDNYQWNFHQGQQRKFRSQKKSSSKFKIFKSFTCHSSIVLRLSIL